MKKFESVEYLGGHPRFSRPCKMDIDIDMIKGSMRLTERGWLAGGFVDIGKHDIVDYSFEEHGTRSVGKTAVGAIAGGVLTGGIGLLVGGAIGAMKKDTSNFYLTVNVKGKVYKIVFKAGRKSPELYGAVAAMV